MAGHYRTIDDWYPSYQQMPRRHQTQHSTSITVSHSYLTDSGDTDLPIEGATYKTTSSVKMTTEGNYGASSFSSTIDICEPTNYNPCMQPDSPICRRQRVDPSEYTNVQQLHTGEQMHRDDRQDLRRIDTRSYIGLSDEQQQMPFDTDIADRYVTDDPYQRPTRQPERINGGVYDDVWQKQNIGERILSELLSQRKSNRLENRASSRKKVYASRHMGSIKQPISKQHTMSTNRSFRRPVKMAMPPVQYYTRIRSSRIYPKRSITRKQYPIGKTMLRMAHPQSRLHDMANTKKCMRTRPVFVTRKVIRKPPFTVFINSPDSINDVRVSRAPRQAPIKRIARATQLSKLDRSTSMHTDISSGGPSTPSKNQQRNVAATKQDRGTSVCTFVESGTPTYPKLFMPVLSNNQQQGASSKQDRDPSVLTNIENASPAYPGSSMHVLPNNQQDAVSKPDRNASIVTIMESDASAGHNTSVSRHSLNQPRDSKQDHGSSINTYIESGRPTSRNMSMDLQSNNQHQICVSKLDRSTSITAPCGYRLLIIDDASETAAQIDPSLLSQPTGYETPTKTISPIKISQGVQAILEVPHVPVSSVETQTVGENATKMSRGTQLVIEELYDDDDVNYDDEFGGSVLSDVTGSTTEEVAPGHTLSHKFPPGRESVYNAESQSQSAGADFDGEPASPTMRSRTPSLDDMSVTGQETRQLSRTSIISQQSPVLSRRSSRQSQTRSIAGSLNSNSNKSRHNRDIQERRRNVHARHQMQSQKQKYVSKGKKRRYSNKQLIPHKHPEPMLPKHPERNGEQWHSCPVRHRIPKQSINTPIQQRRYTRPLLYKPDSITTERYAEEHAGRMWSQRYSETTAIENLATEQRKTDSYRRNHIEYMTDELDTRRHQSVGQKPALVKEHPQAMHGFRKTSSLIDDDDDDEQNKFVDSLRQTLSLEQEDADCRHHGRCSVGTSTLDRDSNDARHVFYTPEAQGKENANAEDANTAKEQHRDAHRMSQRRTSRGETVSSSSVKRVHVPDVESSQVGSTKTAPFRQQNSDKQFPKRLSSIVEEDNPDGSGIDAVQGNQSMKQHVVNRPKHVSLNLAQIAADNGDHNLRRPQKQPPNITTRRQTCGILHKHRQLTATPSTTNPSAVSSLHMRTDGYLEADASDVPIHSKHSRRSSAGLQSEMGFQIDKPLESAMPRRVHRPRHLLNSDGSALRLPIRRFEKRRSRHALTDRYMARVSHSRSADCASGQCHVIGTSTVVRDATSRRDTCVHVAGNNGTCRARQINNSSNSNVDMVTRPQHGTAGSVDQPGPKLNCAPNDTNATADIDFAISGDNGELFQHDILQDLLSGIQQTFTLSDLF